PSNDLNATISATLNPGTYYVAVRSHDRYGDVGQYTLSGSVPITSTSVNATAATATLASAAPSSASVAVSGTTPILLGSQATTTTPATAGAGAGSATGTTTARVAKRVVQHSDRQPMLKLTCVDTHVSVAAQETDRR